MKILIVAVLILAGCVAPSGPTPSFADMLGASYMTVDAVADATYRRCQNEVPGGPCAPHALISTEQKEDVRMALEHALDALDTARALHLEGATDDAMATLQRAQALLATVEQALLRAEQ